MVCSYNLYQGLLYTSFSLVWLFFTIWWIINTWIINLASTKTLQKLIFCVLAFKTLYEGSFGCSMLFCQTLVDEAYWGLANTITFTLYNASVYTVLSLISRGFGLLRNSLTRAEATSIAILMVFVYIGYCAYFIQPSDVAPFLLGIIGLAFLVSIKCTVNNMLILQARHFNLQEANILPMLPELSTKISVLKLFLFSSFLFFINEIVKIVLIYIGEISEIDSSSNFWICESTVEQVFVTFTCFTIFFIYRSKSREFEFNSSDFLLEGAQRIPTIYTAQVPNSINVYPNQPIALAIFPFSPLNYFENLEDYPGLFILVPIQK